MRSSWATATSLTTAAALLLPSLALGSPARGGAYTSARAEVRVEAGGKAIRDAAINCKLRHGVTIEAIDFSGPVRIGRLGFFSFHGRAVYVSFTGNRYRSRMTTVTVTGRFLSSKRVRGRAVNGPGACRSAPFRAVLNPRAH